MLTVFTEINSISDHSRMTCPCVPASTMLKMTLKTLGTTSNQDDHSGRTKFNLSLLVLVTLLVSGMFGGFLTYATKVAVVSVCIRLHNFTSEDNKFSLSLSLQGNFTFTEKLKSINVSLQF